MTTLLFSLALVLLTLAHIAMSITVKHLSKEIDDIKEVLEHHREKLKYLDFYQLSDHEERLYKLETVLELKEYFEGEPLNEEKINDIEH